MESKKIPGKPVNTAHDPAIPVDRETGYVVRIPFRHTRAWGGIPAQVESIEYWTKDLQNNQGAASDELFRVLQELGYWKDGKPTPAAAALRDPRNSHVQVLAFGVHIAPGPIHSTSDRRFQAMIADI